MKRDKRLRIAASVLVVIAALLAASCGGGMARRSAELLDRDYRTMSDSELQLYAQQLGDQLARGARADRAAAGVGFDSDRRRLGAGDEATATALRERWNAVRGELHQRELLP